MDFYGFLSHPISHLPKKWVFWKKWTSGRFLSSMDICFRPSPRVGYVSWWNPAGVNRYQIGISVTDLRPVSSYQRSFHWSWNSQVMRLYSKWSYVYMYIHVCKHVDMYMYHTHYILNPHHLTTLLPLSRSASIRGSFFHQELQKAEMKIQKVPPQEKWSYWIQSCFFFDFHKTWIFLPRKNTSCFVLFFFKDFFLLLFAQHEIFVIFNPWCFLWKMWMKMWMWDFVGVRATGEGSSWNEK